MMPWRRVAFGAAALTTAVAAATVLAITNPETPLAVTAIARTSAAGQMVTAYPSEYLLVLYYADRDVAGADAVLAGSVPWFWGTAVYPPNADCITCLRIGPGGGAPWYVYEPGDPLPPDRGLVHGLGHPLLDGCLCHDAAALRGPALAQDG